MGAVKYPNRLDHRHDADEARVLLGQSAFGKRSCHERYNELVVEVDDPDAAVRFIQNPL